jgi:hypothetical protein
MTNTPLASTLSALCSGLALVAGLCACDDDPSVVREVPPPGIVIVAGDFRLGNPGILTTVVPETRAVHINVGPAMAVGSDPILRHVGTELLIVNRNENNVTILDDQTLELKAQISTGVGSNPQDVAVLGDKLYVATFNGKGLTVLTRGSTATAVIDLSIDDPDGEPNCNSVFLVGSRLFVACERFDPMFALRGPGKVYIVDTATDTLRPELTVTLDHENPIGLFEQIPEGAPNAGDLLISTVGGFPVVLSAGCIERVVTGGTPAAGGCVLDNTMLGGFSTRIAFTVQGGVAMMWATIQLLREPAPGEPPAPLGDLRGFDLGARALRDSAINPSTQVIADVAFCPSGETIVADANRRGPTGLRVYQGTTELTTAPLPIGLGFFSSHGLVCY